ncbi:MAG: LacI family DNA-binding transcriptional regulator [Ardenticatenia bacterium]|nr:LacI family DNA-binding transcriptional regulator [Ardenticatenia bacterium]
MTKRSSRSAEASVSIKDIARAAGVSHSTVSRALRDSPLISPETRARIRALAEEMGYTPDAIAQSLQAGRTFTVGVVVTSIADPFFADVVDGVESVARPAGLSVFLNASLNDPEQELLVIETFHRRRVDGIILAASRIGTEYVERLAKIRVPIVQVSNQAESDRDFLHSVAVDDQTGARMAVEHLIALGHRRIGYIGVTNRPRSNRRRFLGYREALRAAGIAPREGWVRTAQLHGVAPDGDVQAGHMLWPTLWEAGVTAVFCYNDMVAIGALLACREHGVPVPGACSVVGFDNIALTRYVVPPLTTVHQPKRTMGQLGMQMLLELMEGKAVDVKHRVLEPQLVVRESTAPPGR